MQPNYNVSVRFDETLMQRWKAHQLTTPTDTLSGVMKTLLRAYLETPEGGWTKLRKPHATGKLG